MRGHDTSLTHGHSTRISLTKKTPGKTSPASYKKTAECTYSSLGGHSGEGSVSASGFFPHEAAMKAVNAALMLRKTAERKVRRVFIDFLLCVAQRCKSAAAVSGRAAFV